MGRYLTKTRIKILSSLKKTHTTQQHEIEKEKRKEVPIWLYPLSIVSHSVLQHAIVGFREDEPREL